MGNIDMEFDQNLLQKIFGPDACGNTPEEMAITSRRQFVRGQTMLAEWSPGARGRKLTAIEALRIFGFPIIQKAIEDGQASIVLDRSEPAISIKARREALGFSEAHLAKLAGINKSDIVRMETFGKVSSIKCIDKITPFLALDQNNIGLRRQGNTSLMRRFKYFSKKNESGVRLSERVLASLAEAAWVIRNQSEISAKNSIVNKFEKSNNYDFPTYQVGYSLAKKARKILDIKASESISSMRSLIENRLGIPLVETDLGNRIAGATISNDGCRGIVVNINGDNEKPWVRRMTLAHELGHFLWDADHKLENLLIDEYSDLKNPPHEKAIELRANAFAIAFLAPPEVVQEIASQYNNLWDATVRICEYFGISISAAYVHVQNICQRKFPFGRNISIVSDEWKARENTTNDYFPMKATPISRRGNFARVVLEAESKGLVSMDTASLLLNETEENITKNREDILSLYQ